MRTPTFDDLRQWRYDWFTYADTPDVFYYQESLGGDDMGQISALKLNALHPHLALTLNKLNDWHVSSLGMHLQRTIDVWDNKLLLYPTDQSPYPSYIAEINEIMHIDDDALHVQVLFVCMATIDGVQILRARMVDTVGLNNAWLQEHFPGARERFNVAKTLAMSPVDTSEYVFGTMAHESTPAALDALGDLVPTAST